MSACTVLGSQRLQTKLRLAPFQCSHSSQFGVTYGFKSWLCYHFLVVEPWESYVITVYFSSSLKRWGLIGSPAYRVIMRLMARLLIKTQGPSSSCRPPCPRGGGGSSSGTSRSVW